MVEEDRKSLVTHSTHEVRMPETLPDEMSNLCQILIDFDLVDFQIEDRNIATVPHRPATF
jgi:hypothetical protein